MFLGMQKFNSLKIICMTCICFIVLVISGCSNDNAATDSNTIRVGYFPNITHVQPIIGLQNGTFSKALGKSTDIQTVLFNAGPAELEALLTGRLDIGYIGPVPAFNGFMKSKGKIKIIAGAVNGGALLVVRPESNINKLEDLAGKRVAVPQYGNTQDISLRKLMTEAGLKSADKGGNVQVLQISNPDTLALFAKGEIDAALVPEPWGTRLLQQGKGKVLLDWKELGFDGNYATTVVVVRTDFLEKNPELVKKWLQAHQSVTKYVIDQPEAAKKALGAGFEELTGKALPKALLDEAFTNILVTVDPAKASIEQMAEISLSEGYIKEAVPVDKLILP